MIVMCHKPAQIKSLARMSCDTIYITNYIWADLFKKFNELYKCAHKFYEIINDLNVATIIIQLERLMSFVMV